MTTDTSGSNRPQRGNRRRGSGSIKKNPFGEGNARAVAYDLATRAFSGAEGFDQIWDIDPGLVALPQRERALAIHLAAGVLRHLRRLDAQARALTDGKSADLSEPVQWILRLGLFQIIDCDRIPPHAAVSTAVDAAKVVSHQGIAGLLNAVLRRAAREKREGVVAVPPPGAPAATAKEGEATESAVWGERLSVPDWLVELLFARFGREAAARIGRWANSPPSYYFRLAQDGGGFKRLQELIGEHELGTTRQHAEFVEYATVSTSALASGSPLFAEPLGWVQNPAAGLVVRLLDPQPGDSVIDLFAAPGGKTMAIAERIGPSGQVLAVDKNEKRLQRVIDNKTRLTFNQILPIVGDVTRLGPRTAQRVLADVPCSALGTLPKNPEVRWIKTPADVERLGRSQRIWLAAAAGHVAPEGVLVYATCTLSPQENEDVVSGFLSEHPDFVVEPARSWIDARYVTPDGYLQTSPPFDGLDGVFAARLRRRSAP
jgi:16S rRNA (cytosine967-C5)-methyltransferase